MTGLQNLVRAQPVMISFKSAETDASRVHPAIFHAISVAAWEVWGPLGATELVVTALRDGEHRVNTRHKQEPCTAVDLRTHSLPGKEARRKAREALSDWLGDDYAVGLEYEGKKNEHIHVSYIADGGPA